MAAPAPGTKPVPTGVKMRDGFPAFAALSSAETIGFWIKTVKPPGVDGGEMTDETTMHNLVWYTGAPKKLKKMEGTSFSCGYDPNTYPAIIARINVPDTITFFFPDGATIAAYGYLQKFEPEDLKQGEMPMATATIMFTHVDSTGVEQGPVFTAGTGT